MTIPNVITGEDILSKHIWLKCTFAQFIFQHNSRHFDELESDLYINYNNGTIMVLYGSHITVYHNVSNVTYRLAV